MKRRDFIKSTTIGGASAVVGPAIFSDLMQSDEASWAQRPLRWAQLAL